MQSLKNKIVFITGASSGIGKACAEQFAAAGANVILTARRIDRIEKLAQALSSQHQIKALPIQLDVQQNDQVIEVINGLSAEWKNIDILINNAGLALSTDLIQEADINNWEIMIDTNIKGLLYITHAILPGMIARNNGHIVNIGSVAGHDYYPRGNVYSATKHAVKALSEVRWKDKDRAKQLYANLDPLHGDDIADAILYCTTRKQHVNVEEIIVMPTAQASANHVHRRGETAGGNLLGK
jgi:3-hydroxy acid dehydrogenase/malonic semialdehyde reductase